MKNRLRYNLEILKEIVRYAMKHPELRFVQILWSLNIINRDIDGNLMDRFYEEPNVTLVRVKERVADEYSKTFEKDEKVI